MTRILPVDDHTIADAATLIRGGELVAFPTETVYGLGADATNGEAVAKIFSAKGRPGFNPLIVHASTLAMLDSHVVLDETARILADKFWPGPLTMILPRRSGSTLSDLVCAGLPSVGVRIPAHKTAMALIERSGMPIAAPSANRSGEISPTTPHHVAQSLGDGVALILAGGSTQYGLESTILDLSGEYPAILRPGAITAGEIAEAIGKDVVYEFDIVTGSPKSPGQLLRHYAPKTTLRLKAVDFEADEALLAFGSVKFMGRRGGGSVRDLPHGFYRNLSERGDLLEAASNLFSYMKALDETGAGRIAVMDIPQSGIGIAINDRLRRAAGAADQAL